MTPFLRPIGTFFQDKKWKFCFFNFFPGSIYFLAGGLEPINCKEIDDIEVISPQVVRLQSWNFSRETSVVKVWMGKFGTKVGTKFGTEFEFFRVKLNFVTVGKHLRKLWKRVDLFSNFFNDFFQTFKKIVKKSWFFFKFF